MMKRTLKYHIVYLVIMLFACYTTSLAGKTGRTDSPQKTTTHKNRGLGNGRGNQDAKEEKEKGKEKEEKKSSQAGESTEKEAGQKGKREKEKKKSNQKGKIIKGKKLEETTIEPFIEKKFKEESQIKFKNLMGQLSEYAITNKAELFCICNYDYYKPEKEHQLNESDQQPPLVIKENKTLRTDCIDVINHALDLSGYKQYLWKNLKALTENHNICCSVNYYHDRTGAVGFHQDSFGIELFVLLVYLDTVDGPEWKLKPVADFQERIKEIRMKGLMPEKFIADAEELYHQLIQDETFEGRDGSIQWPGEIAGPGGIVGFVDELIIHSTPYKEHRVNNSELLLAILAKMQEEVVGKDEAIKLLETQIRTCIVEKGPHYITIDELKLALGSNLEEKSVKKSLSKLYKRFSDLEFNLRYLKDEITGLENAIKDLRDWEEMKEKYKKGILINLHTRLLPQLDDELNRLGHYLPAGHSWLTSVNQLKGLINISLSIIVGSKEKTKGGNIPLELIDSLYDQLVDLPSQLDQLYQEFNSRIDTVLAVSRHDIYKGPSLKEYKTSYKHTRSRARRLSQELHKQGNAKRLLQTLESMEEEDAFAAHTETIKLLQQTIALISERSPLVDIDKEELRKEIYSQFENLEELEKHIEIVNQMLERLYRRSFLRVWVTALPNK